MENFNEKLETFIRGAQIKIDANIRAYMTHTELLERELVSHKLQVSEGAKYCKLICNGSAWGFIDKTTGGVLKAASWKAPAKHARGNIFDEYNGLRFISAYGPNYLR